MRNKFIICSLLIFLVGSISFGQSNTASLKREALTYMSAGRYGEAIQTLNKYISINPNAADGYNLRGVCYEHRSQLSRALQDLKKAHDLDSKSIEITRNLERVEAALRSSTQKNIEGYKRELARNPNAVQNYLEIGRAYAELGSWSDAETWYDAYLERAQPSADDLLRYCEVLARTNQLAKGERILARNVERFPSHAGVWSRYGYFQLWLGKYAAAIKAFERALSLQPEFAEAVAGLEQARARQRSGVGVEGKTSVPSSSAEFAIDKFTRILKGNPADDETRFLLVDELVAKQRFAEAFQQLDSLQMRSADSIRVYFVRQRASTVRDTVYAARIDQLVDRLRVDPADKDAALRIASAYADLGIYANALKYLDIYLQGIPENEALEIRFRYAQYAAWAKDFDSALVVLNKLLALQPGNLEYQLLRGQIAVWSAKDLPLGQRYLTNVFRQNTGNIVALLALSSVHALQGNLRDARELLERAKRIDPNNKDIPAVQQLFDNAVESSREHERFAILTEARRLAADGKCDRALKKYDDYFNRTRFPERFAILEYADAYSCAKEFDKAIRLYDSLLAREYDFDVSVLRAKNYLWSGDTLTALDEFQRLSLERPSDFIARLYLGETFATMQQYTEARKIYQSLLDSTNDVQERQLVEDQVRYLPPTGVLGALATFPTHIAFAPPLSYYSDNQSFQIRNYGGRLELGVIPMLSLGFSFIRTDINSSVARRLMQGVKGQAFLRFSEGFFIDGGFGTLSSSGQPNRSTYDLALRYVKGDELTIAAQLEHSDAAQILYSPYLIDLLYNADFLQFSLSYRTAGNLNFKGRYKSIAVSDGNTGVELQLKLGQQFFGDVVFGYEYLFNTYNHPAPFVPFTNRARQLYYSPQNIETHSAWLDWSLEKSENFEMVMGGKLGYMPAFRATVREIYGDLRFTPFSYLVCSGKATLGSTARNSEGYNYVSFALSAYIRLY